MLERGREGEVRTYYRPPHPRPKTHPRATPSRRGRRLAAHRLLRPLHAATRVLPHDVVARARAERLDSRKPLPRRRAKPTTRGWRRARGVAGGRRRAIGLVALPLCAITPAMASGSSPKAHSSPERLRSASKLSGVVRLAQCIKNEASSLLPSAEVTITHTSLSHSSPPASTALPRRPLWTRTSSMLRRRARRRRRRAVVDVARDRRRQHVPHPAGGWGSRRAQMERRRRDATSS